MAGALVHLAVALTGGIILYYYSRNRNISEAFFIGSFFPDGLKFGISAILQKNIKFWAIEQDSIYEKIHLVGSAPTNYFTIGFFIFATSFFLYDHHIIKKKTIKEYNQLIIWFIIAVLIHLIIDVFIQESNWLY